VTTNGIRILLGAHIDDFVIICASQQALYTFHARLLEAFQGTYVGTLQRYLRWHVIRTKVLLVCPRLTTLKRFYAHTVSGMQLLASPQCSQTRTSTLPLT